MEKSRAIELLEHLAWDRDIDRNPYGDALNIAIDALRQSEPCGDKSYTLWKESYEELKRRMDELTSCSDLISRQAAIDAAKDWYEGLICGSINGLIKRLNALPTAQPEPQWIPVSEGMPKDYVDVLVWFEYFRYGDYNCLYQTHGIGTYVAEYNSWMINHESGWKDLRVIAWMPLPKPYKPNNK